MRKLCLVAIAVMLFAMVGVASAGLIPVAYPPAPSWFDDTLAGVGGSHPGTPDFKKMGILTYTNEFGGQGDSGTLDVNMNNTYRPTWSKEVYMVIDWWVTGGTQNGHLDLPVMITWPQEMGVYHPMIKTQGPFLQGDGQWGLEYKYTIPIQPATESFSFAYSGVNVGETLHLEYLIETKCFPPPPPIAEPGALTLLGAGLVGLIVRKRRS